jgi:hypothetical protein
MNHFRGNLSATINDDAFHAKHHHNHSGDERRSSNCALDSGVPSTMKDFIDNTPKRRSRRLQDKAGAMHNVSKLEAAFRKKGTR